MESGAVRILSRSSNRVRIHAEKRRAGIVIICSRMGVDGFVRGVVALAGTHQTPAPAGGRFGWLTRRCAGLSFNWDARLAWYDWPGFSIRQSPAFPRCPRNVARCQRDFAFGKRHRSHFEPKFEPRADSRGQAPRGDGDSEGFICSRMGVDGFVRGVVALAGTHQIERRFRPGSVFAAARVLYGDCRRR